MDQYSVLWMMIVIFMAIGQLAVVGWLYRRWERAKNAHTKKA
jgi:cbb3-type cytochrome oxidase subunit 3